MGKRICVTFERISRDGLRRGWLDKDGVEVESVEEAVRFLRDAGAWYPSSSGFHDGIWYSTESRTTSFRYDTTEILSYHLKDFTEAEERAVYEGVVK